MIEAAEQKNTTSVCFSYGFPTLVLSVEKVVQSPFFCSPVVPEEKM